MHKLPENGNLVLKIKQGGFISHPILLHWEIKSSAPVRTVAFAPQTRRIMNKFVLRQSLLLLLTATIWGVAFVAQSVGMDYVGPFTFNAVRCLIGGVVLLPCIAILNKFNRKNGVECMEGETGKEVKSSPQSQKTLVIGGIACGVLLCIASNLQQFGIMYTCCRKSRIYHSNVHCGCSGTWHFSCEKKWVAKIWCGVGIAVAGLYLLCMTESGFSVQKGRSFC